MPYVTLRRRAAATTAAAVLAAVAFAGPASAAIAPVGNAPSTSQGIIMRDGGVCDPIRHMGC